MPPPGRVRRAVLGHDAAAHRVEVVQHVLDVQGVLLEADGQRRELAHDVREVVEPRDDREVRRVALQVREGEAPRRVLVLLLLALVSVAPLILPRDRRRARTRSAEIFGVPGLTINLALAR